MAEDMAIQVGDLVRFKRDFPVGWHKIKVTNLFENCLGQDYANLETVSSSGVKGLKLTAQPLWKPEKVNA